MFNKSIQIYKHMTLMRHLVRLPISKKQILLLRIKTKQVISKPLEQQVSMMER